MFALHTAGHYHQHTDAWFWFVVLALALLILPTLATLARAAVSVVREWRS